MYGMTASVGAAVNRRCCASCSAKLLELTQLSLSTFMANAVFPESAPEAAAAPAPLAAARSAVSRPAPSLMTITRSEITEVSAKKLPRVSGLPRGGGRNEAGFALPATCLSSSSEPC